MLDDILSPHTAKRGLLEVTGQTTCYHIGDDGDLRNRIAKGAYYVLTAASDSAFPGGVFSGNVNLDVAHYAGNQISFTAPGTVSDAAAGLATILTGDTVVIKGSASNDGAYLVTAGGVAGNFTVAAGIVNELAGRYVSLYKRASHANAAVVDAATGLMWSRTTSVADKVGAASTGTLCFYNVALDCVLHPAAADLSIVAPSTLKIIGGAGEISRYHVGDVLKLAGFATAANNLPGWVVSSVAINGADLDIVLYILGATTPTAEVAGGARSISLVTRSIFNYAAAANAISMSGYIDWRLPNDTELISLRIIQGASCIPNAVAFPVWYAGQLWSSASRPDDSTQAYNVRFDIGNDGATAKTTAFRCVLVRSV